MSLFGLLPKEAQMAVGGVMMVGAFGYWVFVGNMSSSTVTYDNDDTNDAEQVERRKQLPEYYLPVHPASKMYQLEEEDRQKAFSPEMHRVTTIFDMPVVASTVREYYVTELPKAGWKIKSDKSEDGTETFEVSKDDINGFVIIHRAEAGCELDLETVKPK